MRLVMQQIAGCGCGKITYGGWEDEWDVLGDTWHGDKAKSRRCVLKKELLPRLVGTIRREHRSVKFDEGNGPSRRRRWGLGGEDALDEINLNLQRI
jgi:hypothetical protein